MEPLTATVKQGKWWAMQLTIANRLCVNSFVFSTFSVFKVVYHEYPFAFSVMSDIPEW